MRGQQEMLYQYRTGVLSIISKDQDNSKSIFKSPSETDSFLAWSTRKIVVKILKIKEEMAEHNHQSGRNVNDRNACRGKRKYCFLKDDLKISVVFVLRNSFLSLLPIPSFCLFNEVSETAFIILHIDK